RYGTPVEFQGHLLEAELGPGLLGTILDGLQHPLEKLADTTGLFLTRGAYLAPLDRSRRWDYHPTARVGDQVVRGEVLGTTMEGRFQHRIMLPLSWTGEWRVTWVAKPGAYTIEEVIAKAVDEEGREEAISMLQRWPVKTPIAVGEKIR